ncbi:glycosyl transferase family protein [Halorubrum aidingense JCM 13560]|uniref:Glycosyl transferase family protein n=1 Tax=Halorubrum aidingense JCM 13560 TaxID=1230454 RepID=M0P9Z2_9EURY|nr:glycosyltransferase family 2 protein [Halorubrum aidingense]EMA66962.1 glycosyl transferase family protein [Halorubrum aidingense JCM 13560]
MNNGTETSPTDAPRVSVIIPTYNRAETLARAVDSALAQTVDDIEVLVVDDGSTDGTQALIEDGEDPRVRYLAHDTNRGVSAARNTGVEAARGDYVAFLDSDDEWLPRKLDRQLSVLDDRGEGWVGVYCDIVSTGLSVGGRIAGAASEAVFRSRAPREGGQELAEALLSMQVFMGPGSTLLVERDVITSTGGFDEGLSIYEDWDLVLRVLSVGKLAYVDEPLAVTHFTGDAPAEAYVANDQRYLERNAELVATLERRGVPVRQVHQMGLVGHFLSEGRFGEATAWLDASMLLRPRNLIRLAFWSALGLRVLASGRSQ